MLTLEQQLLNEIFYDEKIEGHLYFWQWQLVFKIAELSLDDQAEFIDFYCLDFEKSPVEDANLKMRPLNKKKRELIEMCIGDMYQIEPSKLIKTFAFYNEAIMRGDDFQVNTSEIRIKMILNNCGLEYTLPERPVPPLPPPGALSKEAKDRTPHQKQLILLETVTGTIPLYRILTFEGWKRVLPLIELDDKQLRIFNAFYGIKGAEKTSGEITANNPDITKEDIQRTLGRVRMRLMQAGIKKVITLCLDESQDAVLVVENLEKELYGRKHAKQLTFLKNIMDYQNSDEVKILTPKQWELFMNVFDLKKEYRDAIIGLFGLNSGTEKNKPQAAEELGVQPNAIYLGMQGLKVMFHRISKYNNFVKSRAQRLISAFWRNDEQLIGYYERLAENVSKYKHQIAFLQKVTGNNNISEPLSLEYWQEIMDSLHWNEETRNFFIRYFGINGEGEMSTSQIAEQDDNENLAYYKKIMDSAYRNLYDRHVDDLKEALNHCFDGMPFNSFNLGRMKQKDLIRSVSGKEKVSVLSKKQWDTIFDGLDLKPSHRLAFYYFYGIEGFGAGMTLGEMVEYFTNIAKEQGKTAIEFADKIIDFERAASVFNNLIHISYLNLRRSNVAQIISEMIEKGEANMSALVNKNQLDFLRFITNNEAVVILSPDQWRDVLERAGILPIRRKIFSLRFGLADREEKSIASVAELLNQEFQFTSYHYYTLTKKLMKEQNLVLIKHYMDLNRGIDPVIYNASDALEADDIFKHQNQLEFIAKITGDNCVATPLPLEVWQEIMIGLRWTDEMRNYFLRFFDINGDGEMTKSQIAQQDGKSEAHYTKLRAQAYALAWKSLDSLKEEIDNYYQGLPFNGYNIGRAKQKRLLSTLVGRAVTRALSHEEWEQVFNNVPMSNLHRTIFYLAYGVDGYGGGMDFNELATFFINKAKAQGEKVIRFGEIVIEFSAARKKMQYFLHNAYMHLTKDCSRNLIDELLKVEIVVLNPEPLTLHFLPPKS